MTTKFYVGVVLLPWFFIATGCGESGGPGTAPEPVDAGLVKGEAVYNSHCKVCHAQGLNGAPILGNAAMWAPRQSQSEATLVQHATEGFGLMPANSGRKGLADEDIPFAVRYMVSKIP